MEVIIFGALVLFGVIIAVQVSADKAKREYREKRALEIQQESLRRKAMLSKFIEDEMVGWLHISTARVNDNYATIGMSESGDIHYKTYSEKEGVYVTFKEMTYYQKDILSFDIETPDRTKTVTRKEKVPVATKKKRSTVGRAVAGGVLLGPVGAVVGAASGLNGKEGVTYHEVKRLETITVKGNPRLVLGVRNPAEPKLVICFEPSKLAEEWWYRIQSVRA